jgi:hypothetical protein
MCTAMNVKNKTFLSIILGIMFFAIGAYAGYLFINYKEVKQNQTVKIEDKKITDSTKPFKIDIIYPYIADLPEFNQKIDELIQKNISDFKEISTENDNAVKQIDPESYAKYPRQYDLNVGYNKGEVDKNIISIVFEVYSFTGGAHGATNFFPINYDVKNKKDIKLTDLYKEQPDYLQKISDFCIKDLTKQITAGLGAGNEEYLDKNWIARGAGPLAENFGTFLINENNIVFYFPQYQVASYAQGDFKVIMPR